MIERSNKAASRFWALQAVQFGAAFLALFAAALIMGTVAPWVPEMGGYVLLVLAVILFFWLPGRLRRHWRQADQGNERER